MWDVSPRGICYLNDQRSPPTLEFYDVNRGGIRVLHEVEGPVPELGLSVSPDGRWILYAARESESDIMVVENFR